MVTLWGQDRPGITASFTRILTAHAAEVVDIGQASLRDFFGQYLLLDLNHISSPGDNLVKDLLFEASRLDLKLHFKHVSTEQLGLSAYSNLFVFTHFGDALMLAQAGLGIAYNAKEALQGVANVSLARSRMKNIFHLLGITEEDIEEAVSCKGA